MTAPVNENRIPATRLPSFEQPVGNKDDVRAIAANIITLVGMTLIAPAALGTTGLLVPVISLAGQAFLLKKKLAHGGDNLAKGVAELSGKAFLVHSIAIYTFVMMSTLGFLNGFSMTSALAVATYFASCYEEGKYAEPIMKYLNEKLAQAFHAEEPAEERV